VLTCSITTNTTIPVRRSNPFKFLARILHVIMAVFGCVEQDQASCWKFTSSEKIRSNSCKYNSFEKPSAGNCSSGWIPARKCENSEGDHNSFESWKPEIGKSLEVLSHPKHDFSR
jgi:hypothetical protein